MKFKAILLALAVAGASASLAFAEDGPHSGTTTSTTTAESTTTTTTSTEHHSGDCRRFVLRGTITAVGASSFSVAVQKASDGASSSVGKTVTVTVTPDTWVSWVGKGSMSRPNVNDRVRVWGKQCGGSAGTQTAVWVQASTPRPQSQGDSHSQGDNHSK